MKKILLLLVLCAGTGTLMAQNTVLAPFNSTPGIKLIQPLKIDSSWRKLPPTLSTESLLKQQPIDLKNLIAGNNQKTLIITNEVDNMPVAKLNGYSKMPVVVLEGNSKMPIVGQTLNREKKAVQVVP